MPAETAPLRLSEPPEVVVVRLRSIAKYYARNGAPLTAARYAEMADRIERPAADPESPGVTA